MHEKMTFAEFLRGLGRQFKAAYAEGVAKAQAEREAKLAAREATTPAPTESQTCAADELTPEERARLERLMASLRPTDRPA